MLLVVSPPLAQTAKVLVKTGDWNVICAVRDKAKMEAMAQALDFPKGRWDGLRATGAGAGGRRDLREIAPAQAGRLLAALTLRTRMQHVLRKLGAVASGGFRAIAHPTTLSTRPSPDASPPCALPDAATRSARWTCAAWPACASSAPA
jgi:hypothetical protein